MKILKRILKLICAGVILYLVFGIGVVAYSLIWMRPHAERALKKFEESVAVGMKIQAIQAKALEVGADSYYVCDLSPPENDATKVAVISFHRFPGGPSKNVCRIKFKNDIAVSIKYSYRR